MGRFVFLSFFVLCVIISPFVHGFSIARHHPSVYRPGTALCARRSQRNREFTLEDLEGIKRAGRGDRGGRGPQGRDRDRERGRGEFKVILRKSTQKTVSQMPADSTPSIISNINSNSKTSANINTNTKTNANTNINSNNNINVNNNANTNTVAAKSCVRSASTAVKDELRCAHFSVCSGCTVNADFASTPIIRRAQTLFATHNVPFRVHLGPHTHWRTHVKLAVQPQSKWGGIKIGLFKAQSHEVESIPQCRVHHPRINEAVEAVRKAAIDCGVKAYSPPEYAHLPPHLRREVVAQMGERQGKGELRFLLLSLERETNRVQLTLVWNAENYKDFAVNSPSSIRLLSALKKMPIWHSIHLNFHYETTNINVNRDPNAWRLVHGVPFVRERVGNVSFFFAPEIFRQANIAEFGEFIVPTVKKYVPENAKVAELYSGVGVIGLNLADKAQSVLCSDSNEFLDELFDQSARSLPKDLQSKVFFECMTEDDAIDAGQVDEVSVLIADPPRKGLSEKVLKFLTNLLPDKPLPEGLKRFIYVGCGFDSVEKDIKVLLGSGRWMIKAAEGCALFPGSDHIETVVVFDRVQSKK